MRTSRLSDTKIQKLQAQAEKSMHKNVKEIERKTKESAELKKQLDDVNKSLNGNKDYNSAKSSYDSQTDQITKLKAKVAKAKSKKTKTDLNGQLNSLIKKRASDYNKMQSIAQNAGFAPKLARVKRLQRTLDNVEKLIKAKNHQKNTHKSRAERYKTILNNRRIARIRKHNVPIIARKAKLARKNHHTVIYRADFQDATVFELVETSPTETDANDVATKPVDGQTVEANWISQNNREYTATFYMKSKTDSKDADANFNWLDSQFHKLMDWSFKYEFIIKGFSRWDHAYITSVGKSTDQTISADGMIINLTFTYARQAEIKYKRQAKGKRKHKASAKKETGRHAGKSNNYVRVKPGMTYSQIARKEGVSVADLMQKNHWKSTELPVGAKVEV